MKAKLNVVEMKIEDVIPYDNNPRLNEESVDAVAESIRNYGFKNPIIVDKDNVIICGHTRRLAALKLGLQTVPVIVATDLSPEKVKAFRLDDNKTAEMATWDFSKLQAELQDLSSEGYDLSTLSFSKEELDRMLAESQDAEDENECTEGETDTDADTTVDETEYDSKEGCLYQLGKHRLYCGDCTDGANLGYLLKDDGVDPVRLWLTDPPYNIGYVGRAHMNRITNGVSAAERNPDMKIANDKMDEEQFTKFIGDAFQNCIAYMEKGASYYIFHAHTIAHILKKALEDNDTNLSNQLIWVKNHFALGWGCYLMKHEPIYFGWKNGASHRWFGAHDNSTTTAQEWDIIPKSSSHPCLAPGTLVMTSEGYLEVEYMQEGYKVLSADGRFHEVEEVTEHPYTEDIYEITTAGNNMCDMATHNHPYLVWDNETLEAKFVEASELKVGDFVLTPRLKYGTNNDVTELDAWCYGLWLAQGSFFHSGHNSNIIYPCFALNKKHTEQIEKLKQWAGNAKFSVYSRKSDNGVTVAIFDAEKGDRLVFMFRKFSYAKTICEAVFDWSPNLVKALYDGYMAGDGCRISTRPYSHAKSVSRNLASQIRFIAESFGGKVDFYLRNPKEGAGIGERKFKRQRKYYAMYMRDIVKHTPWHSNVVVWNGIEYYARRVQKINRKNYGEVHVINLCVKDNHTFQTLNGMTHNTTKPVNMLEFFVKNSSEAGDIVLDTFGGSGSTLIACEHSGRRCRMMEIMPRYCDVIRKRWAEFVNGEGCDWKALTPKIGEIGVIEK